MQTDGRLVPNEKFPGGIKALADYVHSYAGPDHWNDRDMLVVGMHGNPPPRTGSRCCGSPRSGGC